MGLHTFCPHCEEKVLASFHQFKLTATGPTIDFVSCARCDKILNMEKWVHVERVPLAQEEKEDKRLSPWMERLLNAIPRTWWPRINRMLGFLFGWYVAPDPGADVEVPEILDSFIVQVERAVGEKFTGQGDEFMEFIKHAIQTIDARNRAAGTQTIADPVGRAEGEAHVA